jgi:hypothetical protein
MVTIRVFKKSELPEDGIVIDAVQEHYEYF